MFIEAALLPRNSSAHLLNFILLWLRRYKQHLHQAPGNHCEVVNKWSHQALLKAFTELFADEKNKKAMIEIVLVSFKCFFYVHHHSQTVKHFCKEPNGLLVTLPRAYRDPADQANTFKPFSRFLSRT
jgi:hypothetical protein